MHAKLSRRTALLALGGSMAAMRAQSQPNWPTRPIRMIVPSGAGGGADLLARTVGEALGKIIGQPIVIDNKPGGTGVIAIESLLQQPADGYTLGFMSSTFTTINQALQPKLPYDIISDLSPIVQIGSGGIHLVVSPKLNIHTTRELVALIKANPGKFNYASWGVGSTGHIVMEWFKSTVKIDINHVPYKTISQIYQDLQGGNISIAWVDAASSVPLIQAGKLKVLAISGSHRGPAFPNLPTLTEQGYPFDTDVWYGIFGRSGFPRNIAESINRNVRAILESPELEERLIQLNMPKTPPRNPAEFAATVKSDLEVWRKIVRDNKIEAI